MPPKGASGAAKSKPKATHDASAAPKRAIASNAIDVAEQADMTETQSKKQKKGQETLEYGVGKALKDNFKGSTNFQWRMVLDANGKSLYDRVLERKMAKLHDHKVPRGKKFYKELKDEY